jgi:hypothetical protein
MKEHTQFVINKQPTDRNSPPKRYTDIHGTEILFYIKPTLCSVKKSGRGALLCFGGWKEGGVGRQSRAVPDSLDWINQPSCQ